MIIWSRKLYVDESIKKRLRRTKRLLEQNKGDIFTYCIVLSENENNLFDILSGLELRFSYYKNRENVVVGLAHDKESAVSLVAGIVEEIYGQTGEINVKQFFQWI